MARPSFAVDRLSREQARQADEIAALQQDNHSRSGSAPGPATAADLPYDHTASGLAATNVQAAIDEVAAGARAGVVARIIQGC